MIFNQDKHTEAQIPPVENPEAQILYLIAENALYEILHEIHVAYLSHNTVLQQLFLPLLDLYMFMSKMCIAVS